MSKKETVYENRNEKGISYENLSGEEIEKMIQGQIPFTEKNAENIREKFYQKSTVFRRKKRVRKYAAAAAFLLVCISTTVYAKTIGLQGMYHLVFGEKSGHVEQYAKNYYQTAGSSYTDNGIEVKLISAVRDEKELVAFVSVTDKEGDRLSKNVTAQSFESDSGIAYGFELIHYDEETKTATLVYRQDGKGADERITLDFFRFENPVEHRGVLDKEISLYDLFKKQPGKERETYGCVTDYSGQADVKMLEPGKINAQIPEAPWLCVSNIGFVDGALHIQANAESGTRNTLFTIGLERKNGKKKVKMPTCQKIFFDELASNPGRSKEYEELVYEDIKNASQLKDCRMRLDYYDAGIVVNGHWQLSFKTPKEMEKISWKANGISLEGRYVRKAKVLLTPLGVYIEVPKEEWGRKKQPGKGGEDGEDRVTIKYKDGSEKVLENLSGFGDRDGKMTFIFRDEKQAIESEKVEEIVVNDKKITDF